MAKLILWMILLIAGARAQAPVQFEVASVKQMAADLPSARPGERGTATGPKCPLSYRIDRGRIDIQCATLANLIGYAWRLSPDRIQGPDWLTRPGAARFTIAAAIPGSASEKQVPEMLQALLAERFQLAIHRAAVERPIFALAVAKGGPKLQPAEHAEPPEDTAVTDEIPYGETVDRGGTISSPRMGTVRVTELPNQLQRWEAPDTSLAGIADLIDHVAPLSRPVIDTTAIAGHYRVVLEVSLKEAVGAGSDLEDVVLRNFNDGLRKLGLQLERRKGPVPSLIVDHAQPLPTGN